ncbi:hypothetical protein L345_17948 [Ophiophagus hannah]|uniref:TRASH domain-containing protein n=1 Tax=Ophiophagus hannah TaxID=8665 RepID=V8N365_OPHHA|nr:hypothetical protein L345_17948 [Ophiophagus hannah]
MATVGRVRVPLLNLSPSLKMQRSSPEGGIHLTCHSCHNLFTGKPEILDWQDFTKNLGLCCVTCTYCSQTCQRAVTEQLEGSTWDFCSDDCKSKYLLWYYKVSVALLPSPSLGRGPASPSRANGVASPCTKG